MNMARRRKKLAPRLYTYGQLESLMRLFYAGKRTTILYGGVAVGARPNAGGLPYLEITYSAANWYITLARVYRGDGDSTVYAVVGPPRNADPAVRKRQLFAWKRYAPAFTPHREKRLIAGGISVWYRVRDGVVTHCPSRPGVWLHPPRRAGVYDRQWGKCNPYLAYRSRALIARLRKGAAVEPGCVICAHGETVDFGIYTAPTASRDGKRLIVRPRMHNDVSRRLHHIDGDYAIKHVEFVGMEDSQHVFNASHRWKCSADARNGIVEWLLGDIYIPGPDSF
jgi:hypothetical protein